jgi:hypothetical protein
LGALSSVLTAFECRQRRAGSLMRVVSWTRHLTFIWKQRLYPGLFDFLVADADYVVCEHHLLLCVESYVYIEMCCEWTILKILPTYVTNQQVFMLFSV